MSIWDFFKGHSKLREEFLKFSPQGSNFSSVTWNFDVKEKGQRRFSIELNKPQKEIIDWSRISNSEVISFNKLQKKVGSNRSELVQLMNLSIHGTINQGLDRHKDFILLPVSGATTMDYESEARFLQWIQASFGTLSRALGKHRGDPNVIITGAFFSGLEPVSGSMVLRLICFNLDISYYFLNDGTLQITVFDDKNLGHGNSKTPVFQQIIKVTKPQFYDEIIKLTHDVATAGELV